jgi:hypothetical protein
MLLKGCMREVAKCVGSTARVHRGRVEAAAAVVDLGGRVRQQDVWGHISERDLALLGHISERDGVRVEGRPRQHDEASGPATGGAWPVGMPAANDRRRDQLLVHAGAREGILVHAEHEAAASPAARRP